MGSVAPLDQIFGVFANLIFSSLEKMMLSFLAIPHP